MHISGAFAISLLLLVVGNVTVELGLRELEPHPNTVIEVRPSLTGVLYLGLRRWLVVQQKAPFQAFASV